MTQVSLTPTEAKRWLSPHIHNHRTTDISCYLCSTVAYFFQIEMWQHMAKQGYLKSKTIHLSPTDGKICLTASIVSCKVFFCQVPSVYLQGYTKTVNQHFMKFGQDMEPVLRKKLVKIVVDLDNFKQKNKQQVITFGRIFFL